MANPIANLGKFAHQPKGVIRIPLTRPTVPAAKPLPKVQPPVKAIAKLMEMPTPKQMPAGTTMPMAPVATTVRKAPTKKRSVLMAKSNIKPNTTAPAKARSVTAGPNGSFPIGDKNHARLAIGGATRSYNAGNISKATENSIKAKAENALSKKGGKK